MALGRVELDLDDREVMRTLSRLQVWPIDLAVSRASTRLDFRGDPADELIAATSVVHDQQERDRQRLASRSLTIRKKNRTRDAY